MKIVIPVCLALTLCLPQVSAQSFGEYRVPGQVLPDVRGGLHDAAAVV